MNRRFVPIILAAFVTSILGVITAYLFAHSWSWLSYIIAPTIYVLLSTDSWNSPFFWPVLIFGQFAYCLLLSLLLERKRWKSN